MASSSQQQQPQPENGSTAADRILKPFSLELHDFIDTGRGIRTLVNRSAGDIVLKVPVEDTITTTKLKDLGALSATATVAITQEQQLALGLGWLKRNHNKKHPYVPTMLPKEYYGIWTLPPKLWDELCLPSCYSESFQATRDMVQDFQKAYDEDDKSLLWAFSMVRSRSMAVPELTSNNENEFSLALIPGLDLFNHAFDAGTVLQLHENHWTLTSSKSYRAGDQIYLSYGNDKDNWKFLLTYGFSIPKNPNALVFWTWQELLGAAGMVRPAMFPEHTIQTLLQHPQLQQYTKNTEDRATFSFDCNTQSPRESLQNGLTLIGSLATQLGFPNDDALTKDVLDQLLQNRLAELQTCHDKMTTSDIPLEWKAFWESVQLALNEEETYLRAAIASGTGSKEQ